MIIRFVMKQIGVSGVPLIHGLHGSFTLEHGLGELLVVESDVACEGAGEVFGVMEPVRVEHIGDAAIEALDHAIGLGSPGWCEAVLDAQCLAQEVELMMARRLTFAGGEQAIGELLAVVGEQALDFAGAGPVQRCEKGGGGLGGPVGLDRDEDPARGAVDGDEQVAPTWLIRHLRQVLDVDMQITRLIGLESLVAGRNLPRFEVGQPAHAVSSQTAVQPGTGDRFIEKLAHDHQQVIQRQPQCAAQLHRHRLLGRREGGLKTMRSVGPIVNTLTRLPFADRHLGDVETPRQHCHRLAAGRNLGTHRRRGPGLLVKGDQHLSLPALSSSITPRIIERATSNGYLRGSI